MPELAGHRRGAERDHVGHGEQRGRRVVHREEAPRCESLRLLGVPGFDDELGIGLESGQRVGGEVAAPPQDAGADRRLAGQVADPRVPEFEQVLGGELAAEKIVGADERVLALVAEPVDQHVGTLLPAQLADARILEEAAGHDDAVDAARLQALQMRSLTVRKPVRVAEQDVEAARGRGVLDAAEQGGEERVGDVRDDHGEHLGLAQLQPAGDPVGLVPGLAEERLDPLRGWRARSCRPGSLFATREIVDGCTLARIANSLSVTCIYLALDIRFRWVLG